MRRDRTGRKTATTASRSPNALMRTTSRPASAPDRRYQTVSCARPQSERGSLGSSVAPTVVPETVDGSPATGVAVARLSLPGGPADRAAAAVEGTMRKARMVTIVACLRCLLIASLLTGWQREHLARPQRGGHALVTVLRQPAYGSRRPTASCRQNTSE